MFLTLSRMGLESKKNAHLNLEPSRATFIRLNELRSRVAKVVTVHDDLLTQ